MPPFCLFGSLLFYLIFQIFKYFSHSLQHKIFSLSYLLVISLRFSKKEIEKITSKKMKRKVFLIFLLKKY